MSEGDLQTDCNEYLRTIGAHFIHLEAGRGRGNKFIHVGGIPDLLIYYRSKHILVELKTPTGKLTDSQVKEFTKYEAQGFPVFVIRSLDEFTLLINRLFS